MVANLRQKALRGVAVVAVALAAGQFMQSGSKPAAKPKLASAELTIIPTKVETVAAGEAEIAPQPLPTSEPARLPDTQTLPRLTESGTLESGVPESAVPESGLADPTATELTKTDPCPSTLDLSVAENALINVTLIAACHPDERVILKHAGLAITARTTLTGAIFTDLPAMEQNAVVEVMFSDGTSLTATTDIPEVNALRRFAIQWQADDAFLLHGFEKDAHFGDPEDISGANPNRPAPGVPASAGFISVLGDSTTENPLLAEVYTFPTDPLVKPNVTIEAAVTDTTCGREMLGETLLSLGGQVTKTDLTVAMPECDAIGDYLVLNNLVQDTNIASSE